MSLHASIRPDPRVAKYFSGKCKHYFVPLAKASRFSEPVARVMGTNNAWERSEEDMENCLIKAQKGYYSHIKVPVDDPNDPRIHWLFQRCQDCGIGLVLQIAVSFLKDEGFFQSLKKIDKSCEIDGVLDHWDSVVADRMLYLKMHFYNTSMSIAVDKQTNWDPLREPSLIDHYKEFHLHFSYSLSFEDIYLDCQESYSILKKLRKQFPQINFLPPLGTDLWDPRVLEGFDMEPFYFPCFETKSKAPQVRYSIVIPSYNNQNHLRVVLRHLYEQSVGLDSFEIVVVDDGGSDQTQSLVVEWVQSLPRPMNFKYVFFPRVRPRAMGDSQYRAGIARNLGVKNAVGTFLCFLDSDIVVPADYLESVGKALEKWDAVQAKRINLSQAASHIEMNYRQVNQEEDLIADEAYWEKFLECKDWSILPYNWKYVCTHSFSLRRDRFWELGGLKKNYIFYGFEDTDLGYRLVKGGGQLHLLDTKVFHLFHENTRSEFFNLKSLRHMVLSRTAQIFFLNHLDEDIFENLASFMKPEPSWKRLRHLCLKLLTAAPLWKRKPPVIRTISSASLD